MKVLEPKLSFYCSTFLLLGRFSLFVLSMRENEGKKQHFELSPEHDGNPPMGTSILVTTGYE